MSVKIVVCNNHSGGGVGRRRAATAASDETYAETPVGGTKSLVVQAVDCEIKIGVQVRQHGRVQVNRQRQTVRAVV